MSKTTPPKLELTNPTTPQGLTLETLHQLGDIMMQHYQSQPSSSGFPCCFYKHDYSEFLKIAEDLKAMTSDEFTPQKGWVKLADVWWQSEYKHKLLIQKCIFSAFHHQMSYRDQAAAYNDFIAIVKTTFADKPCATPQ